jgi:uncharacterized protein DUF1643
MPKWICKESKQKTARYLIGKEGSDPLILFTLFPEDHSLEKWNASIKKVIKMSEALNKDGWLIINVYPVKIKKITAVNPVDDKELIIRNREEIGNVFKEYRPTTIWAAWGEDVQQNIFLWNELKTLLKRVPEKINWITIGKLSHEGHPGFNEKIIYSNIKQFQISDYLEKHNMH